MLMAEAEDLFAAWGKVNPTLYAAWETKPGYAAWNAYWAETLTAHLGKLEALCATEKGFTASGATAGELQLFAYLYQMTLVKADCLASAPKVAAWFAALGADERVTAVTSGASPFGDFAQYFIAPPPEPTLEFLYFPLYAKGLGPALNLAFSGLPWKGPKALGWTAAEWGPLKESGEPPFGQLPLLRTGGPAGSLSQCIAIVNYVARKAGPVLEGADEREVALSQMLMAEGEDLYNAWGKVNPTGRRGAGGHAVPDARCGPQAGPDALDCRRRRCRAAPLEELALKVQYPGVATGIESDLANRAGLL